MRFVYFIGDGNGHVKIGISRHPVFRRATLQIGTALPLRLLFAMEGTEADEGELHGIFADERVAGEWFRLSPQLEDFIEYARDNCVNWFGRALGMQDVIGDWLESADIESYSGAWVYGRHDWADAVQHG